MLIKRGQIYYADLSPVVGSEQGGYRPVLIVQNDVGNRHSPTVICAAITSKLEKAKLPTHITISSNMYDMEKDSVILLEQLRTIDKKRLKDKVCHLGDDIIAIDKDGNKSEIEVDTVITSVGYNPAPIAKKSSKVHIIGDASKVGNLRTVIWQAWDTAMKL